MRCNLYSFQEDAVAELVKRMKKMQKDWHEDAELSSVALTAPTGAGKTVICATVAEGLFCGSETIQSEPNAVILWLSDNPALNEQTMMRFEDKCDMLSVPNNDFIIIDADFAKSHKKLERHKVYFLNRQKLVGNLGKSVEGSRTFWDILRDTIEDPTLDLYLMIDEAHRGLGKTEDDKTTSEAQNKTIYAKLIDGQEGLNPPMPVVIGISATISRWDKAMSGRKDRGNKPSVTITNEVVREAGIVKREIELRSPNVLSDVKEQDLYTACRKLDEFTKHWKKYHKDSGEPTVIPLMVVQVEDNVKDEVLWDICRDIKKVLPGLDVKTAFANVFGEHQHRGNDTFNIPYVSPAKIQSETDIRVIFAKDAISTGWDCPRAEVLYSRRKRQDKTYIHQMFGRMIRTPLAHKIETDDFLNKVVCYLPEYDTKSVEEIVELIKNDTEMGDTTNVTVGNTEAGWYTGIRDGLPKGTNIPTPVLPQPSGDYPLAEPAGPLFDYPVEPVQPAESAGTNTVPVETTVIPPVKDKPAEDIPPGLFEVDIDPVEPTPVDTTHVQQVISNIPVLTKEEDEKLKECFENIVSRYVEKKDKDKFSQFFKVVNFLVAVKDPNTDKSWENDEALKDEFCKSVDYAISINQKKYNDALHDIEFRKQRVTRVDPLTGRKYVESVTESISVIQLSLFNVANNVLYKECCRKFNTDYIKCYFAHLADKGIKEDEANNRLTAVVRCKEAMEELEKWAERRTKELIEKHNKNKGRLSNEERLHWEEIVGDVQNWVERNLSVPTGKSAQNTKYKGYPKHVIATPDDGLAYMKLDVPEDYVVTKEIADDYNIAWYRNPSYVCNSSLAIPYEIEKGKYKNFFPDFIFFERTNDGKIISNIIDPHGDWIGDSISRLMGYIEYLKDHGNSFGKVLVVTNVDGEYRCLDLKNPDVVKAIEDFSGTMAKPLFTGKFSEKYE